MKISYIHATTIILLIIIFYSFIPSIYVYTTQYYEGAYGFVDNKVYIQAIKWNFISNLIFLICFVFGILFYQTFIHGRKKDYKFRDFNIIQSTNKSQIIYKYLNDKQGYINPNFIIFLGYISVIIVIIGFINGGYSKLTSYGSNLSAWEYRTLGWDEGSRVLTLALQIARRAILPFVVIYFASIRKFIKKSYTKEFYIFLITLIIGSIMTLDRAPIMLILVMYFFYKYSFEPNKKKMFRFLIIFILIIIGVAGTLTFIQYNMVGFSRKDILYAGFNFFWHRAYLTPTILSVELSFSKFSFASEKLLLAYSRLGFLIGRDYVGTFADTSVFVAPVTLIGDIWRNLGIYGIIVVGFLNGLYFTYIKKLLLNVNPIIKLPATYTVVTLGFYFIFGGFFSMGVIFQMIFIVFIIKYANKRFVF